jgi:hypothetical protein
MQRVIAFILGTGLLFSVGCTNPTGGPFAKNTRVPAPGTYQLRIPSQLNGQAYYNPSQGAGSTIIPPINPASAAPTANVAAQDINGWKQINQPVQQFANTPNYNTPYGSAVGSYAPPQYQIATGTTQVNSGATSGNQNAINHQNRVDSTRLAATDASAVRPPSVGQANPAAGQPQASDRYAGSVQVYQGIYPPAGAIPNGFVNPNANNRFVAQPTVGTPGSYQSPYIRYSGTFAQGNNPYGNAPTGWVSRDGNTTSR